MKLNWGHYIAIFMVAFMIFILSFVYKTFTRDSYDHHLVSKEYYLDEMNYQQEIDAVDNAKKLNESIKLKNTEKGVLITFPAEVDFKNIQGTIRFQRASNVKLDVSFPIALVSNDFLIPKEKLVEGFYNVKIDWSANDVKYLLKEKHYYSSK